MQVSKLASKCHCHSAHGQSVRTDCLDSLLVWLAREAYQLVTRSRGVGSYAGIPLGNVNKIARDPEILHGDFTFSNFEMRHGAYRQDET